MPRVIPLLIAGYVAFCGAALADTRSDVLQRLAHCNELPDGRTWLDCYYAAAQPERSILGLAPAPQAPAYESLFNSPGQASAMNMQAPPQAAPQAESGGGIFNMFASTKVPPEQFGMVNARPGPGINVDRVVEKLSSYAVKGGKFTVTLANGQVWRQTGGPPINWRSTPANYTVTVTYGALHTFNLRVQNGPNVDDTIYKVERVH